MRGLLQGSRPTDIRVIAREILAPRFVPNPTPEEIAELYALELGKAKPPRVYIDQNYRLVVIDTNEVNAEENYKKWKILFLASLSYVPVKWITLSSNLEVANNRMITSMERAYQIAAAPPRDQNAEEQEGEATPEPEEAREVFEDDLGEEEEEGDYPGEPDPEDPVEQPAPPRFDYTYWVPAAGVPPQAVPTPTGTITTATNVNPVDYATLQEAYNAFMAPRRR